MTPVLVNRGNRTTGSTLVLSLYPLVSFRDISSLIYAVTWYISQIHAYIGEAAIIYIHIIDYIVDIGTGNFRYINFGLVSSTVYGGLGTAV